MIPETLHRVKEHESGAKYMQYIEAYPLTIDELITLCRDYLADLHDGFVSNDKAYLEEKLKEIK